MLSIVKSAMNTHGTTFSFLTLPYFPQNIEKKLQKDPKLAKNAFKIMKKFDISKRSSKTSESPRFMCFGILSRMEYGFCQIASTPLAILAFKMLSFQTVQVELEFRRKRFPGT